MLSPPTILNRFLKCCQDFQSFKIEYHIECGIRIASIWDTSEHFNLVCRRNFRQKWFCHLKISSTVQSLDFADGKYIQNTNFLKQMICKNRLSWVNIYHFMLWQKLESFHGLCRQCRQSSLYQAEHDLKLSWISKK